MRLAGEDIQTAPVGGLGRDVLYETLINKGAPPIIIDQDQIDYGVLDDRPAFSPDGLDALDLQKDKYIRSIYGGVT